MAGNQDRTRTASRISALVVGLGLGAAVSGGHGLAWAEAPGSGDLGPAQSSSAPDRPGDAETENGEDAGTDDSGEDAGTDDGSEEPGTVDSGEDVGTVDSGEDVGTDDGSEEPGTVDGSEEPGTVDSGEGEDVGGVHDAGPDSDETDTDTEVAATEETDAVFDGTDKPASVRDETEVFGTAVSQTPVTTSEADKEETGPRQRTKLDVPSATTTSQTETASATVVTPAPRATPGTLGEVIEAVVIGVPVVAARIVGDVVSALADYLRVGFADPSQFGPTGMWTFLAYVRREIGDTIESTFFNGTPEAAPVQVLQTSAGVYGTLNVTDPNGDELAYTVTSAPTKGTVTINADGTYRYTPGAALAADGGTDTFTVEINDNTALHWHFRSGGTGVTTTTVTVTVDPDVADIIEVGSGPQAVAVSPDGQRVYVVNGNDNTVSVFDTSDPDQVVTINVGGMPSTVVATNTHAYVANVTSSSVSIIDAAKIRFVVPAEDADAVNGVSTSTWVQTVTLNDGAAPTALAVARDGSTLYIADSVHNSMLVLDTATRTITATVGLSGSPVALAVDPDGRFAYVATTDSDAQTGAVEVVDTTTGTVVTEFVAPPAPTALALDGTGEQLYVAGFGAVLVYDTATGDTKATLAVPTPEGLVLSNDGTRLYVSSPDSLTVVDTRTNTAIDTIAVEDLGGELTISPDNTRLYVPNQAAGTVSSVVLTPGLGTPTPLGSDIAYATSLTVSVTNFTSQSQELVSATLELEEDSPWTYTGPSDGTIIAPGESFTWTFKLDPRYDPYPFRWSSSSATMSIQTIGYVRNGNFIQRLNRHDMTLEFGFNNRSGLGADIDDTTGNFLDAEPNLVELGPTDDGRGAYGLSFGLLDPSGTTVTVGPDQPELQSRLVDAYCDEDTCSFAPTRQVQVGSELQPLSSRYENTSGQPTVFSHTYTFSHSESNSLTVTAKAGFKISEAINAEITVAYGHTWTNTYTYTDTINFTLQPGTWGQVMAGVLMNRVYGDITILVGDNVIILQDVYFDSPIEGDANATLTAIGGDLPPTAGLVSMRVPSVADRSTERTDAAQAV